ncbi:MAG: hypothetical protein RL417_1731 [Pseudomonadota bacterium]
MVKSISTTAGPVEDRVERTKDMNFGRLLLYGSGEPLAPLRLCRWREIERDGTIVEIPPGRECLPGRLDIALHVDDPAAFDPVRYQAAFDGNIEQLHICKRCRPDIVITLRNGEASSDIRGVWALVVVNMIRFNPSQYVDSLKEIEEVSEIFGQRTLHLNGFEDSIDMNRTYTILAITINFAGIIIIALWLALKAHRKVLDYFSHSGALLPMVAASGHSTFYGAIWVLTLSRVFAFFGAALPLTYYGFVAILEKDDLAAFFFGGRVIVWILALTSSLALATLIASIAELKHRHSLLSFSYKYIPLLICFIGGVIWAATFLLETPEALVVRSATTALPLLGTASILLGPVFRPSALTLAIHLCSSLGLLVVALRYNSRWFAAHLEEI